MKIEIIVSQKFVMHITIISLELFCKWYYYKNFKQMAKKYLCLKVEYLNLLVSLAVSSVDKEVNDQGDQMDLIITLKIDPLKNHF